METYSNMIKTYPQNKTKKALIGKNMNTLYLLYCNFCDNLNKLFKLSQPTWNVIQYYTNAIKRRENFNTIPL